MRSQDEIVKDIKSVLEEKVAPSVAAHNGAIGFIDFASDTGVATLKLSGSCSGCAMSKLTLQQGVERLLKHYVKEVNYIIKNIKKKNKSAKNILDLGCGTGTHAHLFGKKGYKTVEKKVSFLLYQIFGYTPCFSNASPPKKSRTSRNSRFVKFR